MPRCRVSPTRSTHRGCTRSTRRAGDSVAALAATGVQSGSRRHAREQVDGHRGWHDRARAHRDQPGHAAGEPRHDGAGPVVARTARSRASCGVTSRRRTRRHADRCSPTRTASRACTLRCSIGRHRRRDDHHGHRTAPSRSPASARAPTACRSRRNNFQAGFNGIFFLGTQSLTPTSSLSPTLQAIFSLPIVDIAMIIAYLWIWAGFAMVVIGAGLAALNREVLEAAQIDGASEWQTLRRVTVPMLRPVLVVVFVTMLINVLKIFDIILNMATAVVAGRGEHPRARHLQRLREQRRPGPRSRARGDPVRPRHPRHADQPQEDPRMSAVQAASLPAVARRRNAASACARRASSSTSSSRRSPSSGWCPSIGIADHLAAPRERVRAVGVVDGAHRARAAHLLQLPDAVLGGLPARRACSTR